MNLLTAINAKYIHSNLAVYSLKEYARERGQDVETVEFTINQHTEDILKKIYKKKPALLCFSCYIWNIEYVKEISQEFHKLCPQVPIWLGGPEVSYEAEEFLIKNPCITGIMLGEGEETFLRLCRFYDGEGELLDVRGIAYRDGNNIFLTSPAPLLDMDELPFCYDNIEDFKNRIVYYESSRGCPFSCSYCLSSVDKSTRFRSLSLVKKEIQFFLDKRVPQVKFVDRTFNCNHEHAYEIWNYILKNDNGLTNFHFEISADLLNEDEINLLLTMRKGAVQLEIGVQSTNEKTIREINRKMDVLKLKQAVKKINIGNNIHQHLDLIAGLPFEDYETFQNSFNEIYGLKPQQLQLGFLKVLKGSYMHRMAESYGLIYKTVPPYEVMETKWLSYEKMCRIKTVEKMLEIHYNSNQFRRTVTLLEAVFESPFDMYLSLGDFYEEKNLTEVSLSRLARSEALLEFAAGHDGEKLPMYREALTFDLYASERLRKRPSFATDRSPYKMEMNAILKERGYEKRYCHLEPFFYPIYGPDTEMAGKKALNQAPLRAPRWILFDYEKHEIHCIPCEGG